MGINKMSKHCNACEARHHDNEECSTIESKWTPNEDEWKELWSALRDSGVDIPAKFRFLLNEEDRQAEQREQREQEEAKESKHMTSEYHREQYYKKNGWKFTPREFKK
jgi:hypothetical protein